ncbi:MAG: GNAT family N-acetyltransferase [Kiritimatiellaeota bacterium]|nr:GNAT family N-acetyltransferase [Kiritimatiellota bacterium]
MVKVADSDEEFAQISALNYHTFVEEIPQHEPNAARTLTDKFHADNTYIICKDGAEIAGMVACCDRRPFSLDAKVERLDSFLPPHTKAFEIRLLAVRDAHRHTPVLALLFRALLSHLRDCHADLAVISGTTRQLGLYRKLGFKPFYKLVGKPGAQYQPMLMSIADLGGMKCLR